MRYLDGILGLLYHKGGDGGQETGAGNSTRLWFTFLGIMFFLPFFKVIFFIIFGSPFLIIFGSPFFSDHISLCLLVYLFICFLCWFVRIFSCLCLLIGLFKQTFVSPGFLLAHSSRQARTLFACFPPL